MGQTLHLRVNGHQFHITHQRTDEYPVLKHFSSWVSHPSKLVITSWRLSAIRERRYHILGSTYTPTSIKISHQWQVLQFTLVHVFKGCHMIGVIIVHVQLFITSMYKSWQRVSAKNLVFHTTKLCMLKERILLQLNMLTAVSVEVQ